MSLVDSTKQARIEEFLRKSLLGEEVVNTQFHLFSAKSVSSRRCVKPRVLCANNVLLAKSSKYFLGLLSSDVSPSDPSLSDLTDLNDIPSNILADDYGYESDSDLDEDEGDDAFPIAENDASMAESLMASTSPPAASVTTKPKDDDEMSEGGSESDSSDVFVLSPEHPRTDAPFSMNLKKAGSVASSETAVQGSKDTKTTTDSVTLRLRSLGSRHILVKDTAFQTWYTLLNYLYTGKLNFLPLTSTVPRGQLPLPSTSALDEPRCSSKSMFRLTCKVGLDDLRDEALAHIRNNLGEQNILRELSCSLASKHPQLLEMQLDVLYAHITAPPVVSGFPALARRIANKELAHGVDIVIGIHTRLLRERQPPPTPIASSPRPVACPPPPPSACSLVPPDVPVEALDNAAGNEVGLVFVDEPPLVSGIDSEPALEVPTFCEGFAPASPSEEPKAIERVPTTWGGSFFGGPSMGFGFNATGLSPPEIGHTEMSMPMDEISEVVTGTKNLKSAGIRGKNLKKKRVAN